MRGRIIAIGAALSLLSACSPSELFGGDFIDRPFGFPSVQESDIDQETLATVMNSVNDRFRAYAELRTQLPFEVLSTPGCLTDIEQGVASISFTFDVACALPEGSGTVRVSQEDVSSSDTDVTRMELVYQDVRISSFEIHGSEIILETDPMEQGSSMRELDVVQDGITFVYTFRFGTPEPEQLALDYAFGVPQGTIPVRLILPPSTPGAPVSS